MAQLKSVRVWCGCGRRLLADVEFFGKSSACPGCGALLTVPSAAEIDMSGPWAQLGLTKATATCALTTTTIGVIWAGLAYGFGREIGLLAWAMGLASALGMMMGTSHRAFRVGTVAALFALCGILITKYVVFVLLLLGNSESLADRMLENPDLASRMIASHCERRMAASRETPDVVKPEIPPKPISELEKRKYIAENRAALGQMALDSARHHPALRLHLPIMYGTEDLFLAAAGVLTAMLLPVINDHN